MPVIPQNVISPERAIEIAGSALIKEIISHKATVEERNALMVENARLRAELEKANGKKNKPDTPPKS